MFRIVFGLSFCFVTFSGWSQVRLTFTDKTTGESVEGVAVLMKDNQEVLGISNNQGIIEIIPAKFPATIVTSHIAYSQREFKIDRATEFSIGGRGRCV